MSGKAILVLVVGIIIIAATVMFNIEAASTRIVRNFGDYYQRQTTQNVAQTGIQLALSDFAANRKWRAGFSDRLVTGGSVSVDLADVFFNGAQTVRIRSIGSSDYGSGMRRKDTIFAYVRTKAAGAKGVRGLLTLNGPTGVNGNIDIDGRDYTLAGGLVPGSGVQGIWSTSLFAVGGSATVGGTHAGVDYAPAKVPNPNALALNMIFAGGYPTNPDDVIEGTGANFEFPDGVLKAIAQSGLGGSQYATDPSRIKYPLSGVTYVELPPGGEWKPGKMSGDGVLVVHNAEGNAKMKNPDGAFNGLIIADDIEHLHLDFYGAIVGLSKTMTGNVAGNGNAKLRYSREAIERAIGFVHDNGPLKILAWWE